MNSQPPPAADGWLSEHASISWARQLKRGFEIDTGHCPNCGGELKIMAAILETPVIERILKHFGLPARAPPRAPARTRISQAAWYGLTHDPPSNGRPSVLTSRALKGRRVGLRPGSSGAALEDATARVGRRTTRENGRVPTGPMRCHRWHSPSAATTSA
jgi:hypothetical protein